MPTISNVPFDQLQIGQTSEYAKTVTEHDIQLFAVLSGDANPVHLDPDFAANTQFGERIAHGMLTGAVISAAIAMQMPGPGTIYLGQTLAFKRPVKIGDTVTVTLTVAEKHATKPRATLDCVVTNQNGQVVVEGQANVMVPTESQTVEVPTLPSVSLQR